MWTMLLNILEENVYEQSCHDSTRSGIPQLSTLVANFPRFPLRYLKKINSGAIYGMAAMSIRAKSGHTVGKIHRHRGKNGKKS